MKMKRNKISKMSTVKLKLWNTTKPNKKQNNNFSFSVLAIGQFLTAII